MQDLDTKSLPEDIVKFAIASTCEQIAHTFTSQPYCHAIENASGLIVTEPAKQPESLLWESYHLGWPWLTSDIGSQQGSHEVLSTGLDRITLAAGTELCVPEEKLFLVNLEKNAIISPSREQEIHRAGMALATDWSDAWSSREPTREIQGYARAFLANIHSILLSEPLGSSTELDEPVDSRWLPNASEKLDELVNLNANWDGHGAEAPNPVAIIEARKVLYELEKIDFEPSRILPSAVGGVSLCFFKPKKYGEIECYNTGESIAIIKDTRTNWRRIWEVDSVAESVIKVRNYLLGFTTK